MRSQVHEVVSRVLLEVNVSGEESKSGFTPQEAFDALPRLMELEGISVEGLMTMLLPIIQMLPGVLFLA